MPKSTPSASAVPAPHTDESVGDASDLIGQINLQGQDAGGTAWNETGVTWMESTGPAVPGIGALAPLACIGLVRRRRRG